jgi:hypothetical protein
MFEIMVNVRRGLAVDDFAPAFNEVRQGMMNGQFTDGGKFRTDAVVIVFDKIRAEHVQKQLL